jgi:hypothetical protein
MLQAGLATGACLLPALAKAAQHEASGGETRMDALIAALNAIGTPDCVNSARRLEALKPDAASFDLHLRRAGLDAGDARLLAGAMRKTTASSGTVLRSFIASYNSDLSDAGVIALAEAFPATMTELGLVGCAIGDAGGLAILAWAKTAQQARMICVEGNAFSADVRSRFAALGQDRGSLLVVV